MKSETVQVRLCLFDTEMGGPKHPQPSNNRSMLFRFATDDRIFGATATFDGDPLEPGRCRSVVLEFMFPEALDLAVSGVLFEVCLGSRVVGLGQVA